MRFPKFHQGKENSFKAILFFYEHVLGIGNWKISSNQFFMVILFWALLTSILIKKLGIPKNLAMLEFEGIRIITLGVKDSIDLGRESRTPLKCDRVKDSINLVESRTLVEKTLNQNLRKFLFW